MEYRIVTDNGEQHGLILGRHKTYGNAVSKVRADQEERGPLGALVFDSEDSFKTGQLYPDHADAVLKDQRPKVGVQLLEELHNADQTGDYGFLIKRIEDHGWTPDTLRAEFSEQLDDQQTRRTERHQDIAERKARRNAEQSEVSAVSSLHCYSFPAVAGVQAGKQFYSAMIPFQSLVRLFNFTDAGLPPEQRAQRQLNEPRARKIGEYIRENRTEYVLPAITACCDAAMKFEAQPGTGGTVGMLKIPMESRLLINDGQHRRRGIEFALEDQELYYQLKDESVTVTIYFDEGLARSQQIFADINKTPVKPTANITALYDLRDPVNNWVLSILDAIPHLKDRIERETGSISKNSDKLFTLTHLKKFALTLCGCSEKVFRDKTPEAREQFKKLVTEYLRAMDRYVPGWGMMTDTFSSAADTREQKVIGHAVFLQAAAVAGKHLIQHQIRSSGVDFEALHNLQQISTERTAPIWEGRCVIDGKMNAKAAGVNSTAAALCDALGMGVPSELQKYHV